MANARGASVPPAASPIGAPDVGDRATRPGARSPLRAALRAILPVWPCVRVAPPGLVRPAPTCRRSGLPLDRSAGRVAQSPGGRPRRGRSRPRITDAMTLMTLRLGASISARTAGRHRGTARGSARNRVAGAGAFPGRHRAALGREGGRSEGGRKLRRLRARTGLRDRAGRPPPGGRRSGGAGTRAPGTPAGRSRTRAGSPR